MSESQLRFLAKAIANMTIAEIERMLDLAVLEGCPDWKFQAIAEIASEK